MLPLFQATSFHHPLPPGRLSLRPRLFAYLDEGLACDGGLVLLIAPTGFGKTTLASAWLASRTPTAVWLSLSAGDNEPRQLLRQLVIALGSVIPAVGARLLPQLAVSAYPVRGTAEDEVPAVLDELFAMLSDLPAPVVLALDDVHLLSNQGALDVLAELATGAPTALRLVVCADGELPAPLAAAWSGSLVLGEPELGFSVEEAADLLVSGMGLATTQSEVADLVRLTGGSPASLLLCALALAGHPDPRRLIDTLDPDAAHPLEDLLARQLAVGLGAEAVTAFRKRASRWYEDAGRIDEAARHAFAAGDPIFAAELVERQGAALLERGEWEAVAAWCQLFGEAVFAARPRLCLLHAWSLVLATRGLGRDLAERRLAQVEQSLPGADEATQSWLIGHRANLRGHLLLYAPEPDFAAMIAQSQQAMALLPEDDAAIRSMSARRIAYGYMGLSDCDGALRALEVAQSLAIKGRDYYGAISCIFDQVRIAHYRGALREAARQCRLWQEALPRLASDAGPIFAASGRLDLALGCVLLDQGDLAGAAARLVSGLELTGTIVQFALVGYPALARLREAQGDSAGAAAALARLEEIWPETATYTRALLALLRLRAVPDDHAARAAALAWVSNRVPRFVPNTLPPGIGKTLADEPRYGAALAWARIQTILGRPREALACLEPLAIAALKHGLAHRVIELSVAQSLALEALGGRSRAQSALARALALARPEGYVQVFAQEPGLAPMLAALGQVSAPALEPVIPAPEPASPTVAPQLGQVIVAPLLASPPLVNPSAGPDLKQLSNRELEVLRLLTCRASNDQIARHLLVSINTVKTHLRHIYEKLDVGSRQDALARAQELGLLEYR